MILHYQDGLCGCARNWCLSTVLYSKEGNLHVRIRYPLLICYVILYILMKIFDIKLDLKKKTIFYTNSICGHS